MLDYIFILGAQGSGKTTIARLLKKKLNSPHVDFDWIRGMHLNENWDNISDRERNMSRENLIYILKNYKKNKYQNIIASGFSEKDIQSIIEEFKTSHYVIFTLYLSNDEELTQRVLNESRDSGFRDFEQSIQFNKKLREELRYPNEQKIDNTIQLPEHTLNVIMQILSGKTNC